MGLVSDAGPMSRSSYPLYPPSPSFAAAVLAVMRTGAVVDVDPDSPDLASIDTLINLGWPCITVPIRDPDGEVRSYGFRLNTRRLSDFEPLIIQMASR
jgi:hypothetical protein